MNFLSHFMRLAMLCLLITAFGLPAAPLLRPLTPDQGLSQGSVNNLLLDDDGFLWVATAGGLNRFDGNRVIQVGSSDSSLKEVNFTRLLLDSDRIIYAASAYGDIYRYQPLSGLMEPFTTVHDGATAQQQFISALIQQNDDYLLAATNTALLRVNRSSGETEILFKLADAGYPQGWLRHLHVYQHYVLIAAFNGVIAFDTVSGSHTYLPHIAAEHSNLDNTHVKFLDVYQNKLWIGTVDGLYSISLDAMQAYLQQKQPYTATVEIAGLNIWKLLWQGDSALIPTESGLYRFTPDGADTVLLLKLSDSALKLFEDTILDIAADNAGGYWLASRDDGAFYWHPRSSAFKQLTRQDSSTASLSSDKIFSLLAEQDGTLWIGTANGLNKMQLPDKTLQRYLVSDDPKAVQHGGTIYNIYHAGNNQLWLVTAQGLKLFDTETGTELPLPGVNATDKSRFNHLSHNYYLYGAKFYFFHRGHFLRYNPANGTVDDISSGISGQLTIGSQINIIGELSGSRAGLLLSRPDEIWLWQPTDNSIQLLYRSEDYKPQLGRSATSAIQDSSGMLWVGMSGIGLLGFDTTSLSLTTKIDSKDNLLSDAIYSLQRDSFGDLWFSSHAGLARLDTQLQQIEFFTREDGVYTNEYNAGAAASLADGTLAYGSMRGVTLVNPALLQQKPSRPEVVITGLSTLSGEFNAVNANLNGRTFYLSHEDLGVSLRFSSMNFSEQHKMRYRFWLEGSDNVQYPAQRDNSVIFPQLDYGDYVFNIVAISPASGQESEPARLYLSIRPPLWQSTPALAAYILLLLFTGYKFYRFRRHQLREVRAAHDKVKQSEQRLKQALSSVNSGAWEWNAASNQLFAARVHTMLGYSEQMNPLTMQQHMTLIHPDDRAAFTSQWQRFLQEPDAGFDCTYRMQHQAGQWLWFRDVGKATLSNVAHKVEKVIGTFSNITETRANMEKARLFGEAFQQTRDWVVILDNRQRVVAANHSFATAFGNMAQYLDQPRTHHLGISLVRRRFYTKLLRELTPGQHWQGEELVITPDGRERPTLINISAIGEQQQHTFYVLVFTDITAQKLAEDELRYLANYDALTGLPNRALLMDRIYHGIDQAKRDKRSLALCFIDLDKFKQINDSLGHDIGDLLLKEVARRLTLTLRDSDTVARLGGDEFVILLEGYKAEDNISHVARKMLAIVGEPMQFGTHTVGVSPSIGIAVYPEDALNAAELLKHADVAMYHAKEAGRNNYQFFTAEMNEKAHMRLARETRLRQALKNDEFVNFYQPIINSQTRQVVGAEVLLRWQSSDGMISPTEFIPLAEELRLIINMTHQLLERALSDLKQWHEDGHHIYLSVNLSTQHLEQPALAEHTRFLLGKYQLPASCLRFEVTESALMRDHQSAIETMLALSELGVQLALDDFGTGYSSLKYLKELPIDGIKIDRSFVQDIGIDSSDETIIDAMLSMANSLGMYCVAEGVETEQQLAFFSRRQCYLIQGYLFAKPMPAGQLLQFLHSENLSV